MSKRSLYLTDPQFTETLQRLHQEIQEGLPFEAVRCDAPGAKDLYCSWGACTGSLTIYPDEDLHLFDTRPSPKYRATGQHCPLDRDQDPTTSPWGCAGRCRVFAPEKLSRKPQRYAPLPTRAETLSLFAQTLQARTRLPVLPTEPEPGAESDGSDV
jgi:hypothetical protein